MIGILKPVEERLSCPNHGPFNYTGKAGDQYNIHPERREELYTCAWGDYSVELPSIRVENECGIGFAPEMDFTFEEEKSLGQLAHEEETYAGPNKGTKERTSTINSGSSPNC